MRRSVSVLILMYLCILLLGTGVVHGQSDGSIVAWGHNDYGQCNVPAPNEGFVAVAGAQWHSLGLKSDSTIVAWGRNDYGQCNVPAPNEGFVAVAGGGDYHSLGLKSDSTIVAWGLNASGQCDVPLPNEGFVAVAAGGHHSLGLKSDGMIVTWGYNYFGQCTVPGPNADFVEIAGGWYHSLGLRFDGTIAAFGANTYGQRTVPAPNVGFFAVAAGHYHSLGLKGPATAVEEPGPGDVPGASMLAIVSLSPNPFNPYMEVSFETRGSGPVIMEIYDVRGRRVRTLPLGVLGPGLHWAQWDGRDASGHDVSSGVYFVRLRATEGESRAVKAVVVR